MHGKQGMDISHHLFPLIMDNRITEWITEWITQVSDGWWIKTDDVYLMMDLAVILTP